MHVQNILAGVDLHHADRLVSSELGAESRAAVAEALLLAATWDATVTFCSVLEISAQSQLLVEHDREAVLRSVENIAADSLAELVNQANLKGIAAKSLLRYGLAWEELSKESAAGPYDLTIVGTRSKQRSTSQFFGSTSQKLIRFSPWPVWVVKPAEKRDIREVAIATDLSPAGDSAFRAAIAVARAINARLHILHAIELADFRYLALAGITEDAIAETESRLRKEADEKLRAQLRLTDFRSLHHGVKIEYLIGAPDTVIPEYVSANKVDLLVIGSHGHSGLSGLLLGNTAERMLPGIHASLMVVKPAGLQSPYGKSS